MTEIVNCLYQRAIGSYVILSKFISTIKSEYLEKMPQSRTFYVGLHCHPKNLKIPQSPALCVCIHCYPESLLHVMDVQYTKDYGNQGVDSFPYCSLSFKTC